jgi:hypothetical protein
MEVKLGGGDVVYKILSASLEPANAEKRLLKLTIRFTVNYASGVAVSGGDFRLLVDDVPREPIKFSSSDGQPFSFVVEGGSAKEGDVVFEVPTTENDVVLQMSSHIGTRTETTKIPFDLTATES